ncbi:class I SAM-dependent methyltransferase, partial [Singulisphaera rosea]
DRDELLIQLANRDAARRGLPATFRHQGLEELDEVGTSDLAFTRFLLCHLPRPEEAAGRIARAVKPGGMVVAEDVDFPGHFCYPSCSAFDRYVELYQSVARANGGDPTIGPKLFGIWRNLGLVDVQVRLVQPMFTEGEGTLVAAITLEHIREAVVAAGFASDDELDNLVVELVDFASAPNSLISLPRIFQVYGRVPGPTLSHSFERHDGNQ